jgi:hypothetical protein
MKEPNFNGRVHIKYLENGKIKERECWYETGDRRFPKGFSLLPPYLIDKIISWEKVEQKVISFQKK